MATNKHAQIRYQALDRCFSNFGRRYFMEDLVEACNDAIYQFGGITDGVKSRQIFDDIRFMESEAGWSVPLERYKDGRRRYYRYNNNDFSINKQPINDTEARQLKEAILMLSRFKGMPQFEWMEEMLVRLEGSFGLKDHAKQAVGFESNPYLKGLEFFTPLFNAIVNKRVLRVDYQPFGKDVKQSTLHPYYLKQYNNRWFLFALDEKYKTISNLALDRIEAVVECEACYLPNVDIDFEEYFDDVIGVTIPIEGKAEKTILKVNDRLLPYIKNKPLHGSQKIRKNEAGENIVELEVVDNYELQALIFSSGEAIEVFSPQSLREKMKERVKQLYLRYQ